MSAAPPAEVFVSYSSLDSARVFPIVDQLQHQGVSVWIDRQQIEGATFYAEEIVRGIHGCKVLLLACSDAAMRSWAVKQEIQLAGEKRKTLLPLLLEPTTFSGQIEYFLAGRQWIEVRDRPVEVWLPQVLRALSRVGVRHNALALLASQVGGELPRLEWGLEELWNLGSFSNQLSAIPVQPGPGRLRSAGGPGLHQFRLGSPVRLTLEIDRPGYLLLLDRGTSGTLYCLCPSAFAPSTRVSPGLSVFPQAGSPFSVFELGGKTGREQLLAIVSDQPLPLDWSPGVAQEPARVLTEKDTQSLLESLRDQPPGSWTAYSTWFEVHG